MYHTYDEITTLVLVSEGTGVTLCFRKMVTFNMMTLYLTIAEKKIIRSNTKQAEKE
jgi:hypothetical protein